MARTTKKTARRRKSAPEPLAQIRDLLFGPLSGNLAQQLRAVRDDQLRRARRLQKEVAEQKRQQTRRLATAGKRATAMQKAMAHELAELQRRLTQQQKAAEVAFAQAIADLETRMMAQLAATTTKLEATIGELRAGAADRSSLADLFEDFAQRVGGGKSKRG